MKTIILSILLMAFGARAADYITATITVTNSTVNGETITLNSSVRSWTNSVSIPSSQILTNVSAGGSATNLYNHLAIYGGNYLTTRSSTNVVTVRGTSLTVSVSTNWATLSLSTNTTTNGYVVSVPFSNFDYSSRTNIGTLLISDLNSYPQISLNQNSNVSAELVGLTNAQTISGNKTFTGRTLITNGVLPDAVLTNAVNYGNAFSSPGSVSHSEQFGLNAVATADGSLAVGSGAQATNSNSVAIGPVAFAAGSDTAALGYGAYAIGTSSTAISSLAAANAPKSIAIGVEATVNAAHDNSVALGYQSATTTSNQIMLGTTAISVKVNNILEVGGSISNATHSGTNVFTGDISLTRRDNSALANGNNAGVIISTNVYVKLSGPTGAFTINGIAGGRDGRYVILQNSTGYSLTLANNSGTDPTAANRIFTGQNADVVITNNPAIVRLIYDSAVSRWVYMGSN